MNYKEFIDNILTTRGRFACGDEYKERHHIIPKCMGGTNDKDNLIDLYAREHFEAHRLLALENPNVRGLTYAWWCMCNLKDKNQNRIKVTAQEYEEARKHYTKLGLSEDTKNKLRIYAKKRWENDEYRKKQSERMKLMIGYKNPNFGNHKLAGKNNPNYGKPMSEEQKKKISIARKGKYTKENSPRAIPLVQFNTNLTLIKVYPCCMSASEELHIDNSDIGKVCKGQQQRKTAGGFIWKYLYDQTKKDGTIIQGAISLGLIIEEEALKMLKQ